MDAPATKRPQRKRLTLVERLAEADARRANPPPPPSRPFRPVAYGWSPRVVELRLRVARMLESEGHGPATIAGVLGIGESTLARLLDGPIPMGLLPVPTPSSSPSSSPSPQGRRGWHVPEKMVETDIPPPPE